MYCSNCGTALDENSNFCPKCGKPCAKGTQTGQGAPPSAGASTPPPNGGQRSTPPPQAGYQRPTGYQQQAGNQQRAGSQQQTGYARMAPVRAISFGDAIKLYFTQYVQFEGRATRSEYWWVFLFNFIVGLVLSVVFFPLSIVYSLAVLLPSLGLHWRRMHDTGRSGAFTLLALIPFVGAIIVLVFCCFDSDGDNIYGPRKI